MSSRQHRRTPKPELTPDQQAYKDGLSILVHERDLVMARLADAQKRCPHVIYDEGSWRGSSGHAACAICGEWFGWWCPESPDHACHYFTVGTLGMVKLTNDEMVPSPAHDLDYESEDGCLWCGQPKERK